jgi:hypothetical protein
MGLQDSEAAGGPWAAETVGWVAIQEGATTTSDGRHLRTFAEWVDDMPGRLGLRTRARGRAAHDSVIPMMITDTGSSYDPMPCFLFRGHRDAFDVVLQTAGTTDPPVEVAEEVCILLVDWSVE